MSAGVVCRCRYSKSKRLRLRFWHVTAYRCNYSAFDGYRCTPSDYSAIECKSCGARWRTKAEYVGWLEQKR